MAQSKKINHRFLSNVKDEPRQMLKPIGHYNRAALVTLKEACEPLKEILDDELEQNIQVALLNSKNPGHQLTEDESASIHLYTMEWNVPEKSLYSVLNKTLREPNRAKLEPWFKYLKLILTAFFKLPSTGLQTVWRGVRDDLSEQYSRGDKKAWWSFSSCSHACSVLESPQYLGAKGKRTLFSIETSRGKKIEQHSYFGNEEEILLPPGSYFEVVSKVTPADGLYLIHLREVNPPYQLLVPPFDIVPWNNNQPLVDTIDVKPKAKLLKSGKMEIDYMKRSYTLRTPLPRELIKEHYLLTAKELGKILVKKGNGKTPSHLCFLSKIISVDE